MLIIEIDYVDTESTQAVFACLAHIISFTANSAKLRLGRVAQNSKLCCNDDLLPMSSEGAPEQLFICVRTVHVRCVEKM